jgi:hypothetical protein
MKVKLEVIPIQMYAEIRLKTLKKFVKKKLIFQFIFFFSERKKRCNLSLQTI